jgi:hypothetical protein
MSDIQGGFLIPRLDGDGKSIVASSPASPSWSSWITSAGDLKGPPIQRGQGPTLQLVFVGAGTQSKEIQFAEPVQMHDGGANFDPSQWDASDEINFFVQLDPTATTPNGTNTGNCNKVPIPGTGGMLHVIVPAAGNGAFDVDLSTAIPVPSQDTNGSGTGYWNSDYDTGVITPGKPGAALFNLYDFPIKSGNVVRTHFHNMRGSFELPAYGVEWIHPTWRLTASVTKNSPGGGTITGWVRVFRKNSQLP